ncbi:hypothetical protein [Microcoleus sp. B13-B6]|uniref:hypothetical protein n=1 Tax=Microcoleus sp. B13-B6 TaxID=2818652 RepID=UPI002FD3833E
MLHHSQLAFYEQAFRPVPQQINFLVEQASCLLLTMVQYLSINQLKDETAYIRLPT